MIGWIILAVYVIGWAGFSVTIARFLADDMPSSNSTGDKVMMSVMGMLFAIFWPLVIPGAWVYKRAFGPKKGREDG